MHIAKVTTVPLCITAALATFYKYIEIYLKNYRHIYFYGSHMLIVTATMPDAMQGTVANLNSRKKKQRITNC